MGMHRLPDDPRRIEAGILYVLRHNLSNGHTCLPADKLIPTTMQLLQVGEEAVKDVLASMTSSFTVKQEEMEGRRFLFLNHLHQAERFIAARIRLMTGFPPVANPYIEAGIDAIERSNHIRYEGQQRLAKMCIRDRSSPGSRRWWGCCTAGTNSFRRFWPPR